MLLTTLPWQPHDGHQTDKLFRPKPHPVFEQNHPWLQTFWLIRPQPSSKTAYRKIVIDYRKLWWQETTSTVQLHCSICVSKPWGQHFSREKNLLAGMLKWALGSFSLLFGLLAKVVQCKVHQTGFFKMSCGKYKKRFPKLWVPNLLLLPSSSNHNLWGRVHHSAELFSAWPPKCGRKLGRGWFFTQTAVEDISYRPQPWRMKIKLLTYQTVETFSLALSSAPLVIIFGWEYIAQTTGRDDYLQQRGWYRNSLLWTKISVEFPSCLYLASADIPIKMCWAFFSFSLFDFWDEKIIDVQFCLICLCFGTNQVLSTPWK